MGTLTRKEAVEMIQVSGKSQIFGVKFRKKNGEMRTMSARLSVRKGVTGAGLKFDPEDYGLLVVYDMNNGFRMVNVNTVEQLAMKGEVYEVVE